MGKHICFCVLLVRVIQWMTFPWSPFLHAHDCLLLFLSPILFSKLKTPPLSTHFSYGTHSTPLISFVTIHNAFSESIVTLLRWLIKIFTMCSTQNYRWTRQRQNNVPIFFAISFLRASNVLLAFLSIAECWTDISRLVFKNTPINLS